MDTFYSAYLRFVNGSPLYFVKKFSTYPELNGVPPILENYGMHTDFYRACKIAQINDSSVIERLLDDIKRAESNTAKVILMNSQQAINVAQ
ncbi:MAG: hypothetical protein ABIO82_04790 [Ginsengibacter sp.]